MNAYAKLGDHKMARFILNSMMGSSKDGNIVLHEIPRVKPTIISFNTLADACKAAGDLAAGLEVLQLMSSQSISPDARTYAILISTVARKTKQQHETRDVRSGGERDPDKAFDLLYEMQDKGIKPNGVIYCALIDV
jgi:pentatricopeptide repeat protein